VNIGAKEPKTINATSRSISTVCHLASHHQPAIVLREPLPASLKKAKVEDRMMPFNDPRVPCPNSSRQVAARASPELRAGGLIVSAEHLAVASPVPLDVAVFPVSQALSAVFLSRVEPP
jgi:hypothetical protein